MNHNPNFLSLMGFKHFFAFLLVLSALLLLFSFWPASCNEIVVVPKKISTANNYQPAAAYQVLRIKNTTPFFLNKPEDRYQVLDKKKIRRRKTTKRRKMYKKDKYYFRSTSTSTTRPFSVMLPKGFVPPSGSSPCHNDKPDSSSSADRGTLFCGLSTTSSSTAKP